MTTSRPPCRLFIILARAAPRAVIFRRGPSDWFQLILWHTDTDEFDYGQWFHGHIFIRRCDLSPDGTKLIYFARKMTGRTIRDQEYTYSWTAISKPPYYTALALWPKGDSWHGGGLFENDHTVFLNHKPERAIPHPNHQPLGLDIHPNPEAYGEDEPIFGTRLTRDGWVIKQEWQTRYAAWSYTTDVPEIRVRKHSDLQFRIHLIRRIDGLVYREVFWLLNREGQPVMDTSTAEWLDWDHSGRLVVLRQGKLSVGTPDHKSNFTMHDLADFDPLTPEPKAPPDWASQ